MNIVFIWSPCFLSFWGWKSRTWLAPQAFGEFFFCATGFKTVPLYQGVEASKYQACVTFYKMGCREKQLPQCFQTNHVARCFVRANQTILNKLPTWCGNSNLSWLKSLCPSFCTREAFFNLFLVVRCHCQGRRMSCSINKLSISELQQQQKIPSKSQGEEFVLILEH